MVEPNFFSPVTWPKRARRIFILTLPISLPLWLAACFVAVCAAVIFILVMLPIWLIQETWRGQS